MSYSSDSGNGFGRPTAGIEFGAVAAFAAAWEADVQPPLIADYLPGARLDALIELIRIDLRHRWLRRPAATHPDEPVAATLKPKPLREYCSDFPELTRDRIPASLVYDEFVIRRHSGECVDLGEYLREYPEQAAQLRELLNADDEDQSTRRGGPELAAEISVDSITSSGDATRTAADPRTAHDTTGTQATRLDRIVIGDRIDDFDLLTALGPAPSHRAQCDADLRTAEPPGAARGTIHRSHVERGVLPVGHRPGAVHGAESAHRPARPATGPGIRPAGAGPGTIGCPVVRRSCCAGVVFAVDSGGDHHPARDALHDQRAHRGGAAALPGRSSGLRCDGRGLPILPGDVLHRALYLSDAAPTRRHHGGRCAAPRGLDRRCTVYLAVAAGCRCWRLPG
ncbi:hypothetical protein [Nocardia rhizosphaerihabitans]|uniref:DUF5753 domain-containing protein n=1 Tax=Nocardia rhizosphaerihabitans TaxID=1691570 RepID=A0ABQ2KJG9_9NOCA|nr:hypothetical protein [Nocardia rhizosphaerihabitans]GGN83142.1 hypothetical protein GCM10011610_35300 [Nocardia rhizosphaerihabitans]